LRASTFISLESLQQFLDRAITKPEGIYLGPFSEKRAIGLRMRLYKARRKAQKENQEIYGGRLPDGHIPNPEQWKLANRSPYDSLNISLVPAEGVPDQYRLHLGAQTRFDFDVRDGATGELIPFQDPIVWQKEDIV
jgi:hypothetical protein